MNCALVNVGQRDGKCVHKCQLCRKVYLSKYENPSMLHAQCRVKARQAAKPQIERPANGPGRELEKLIGELNLPSLGCGACQELAKQMDLWGPDGCREHREHILRDIRSRANKVSWWDKGKAAMQLIREPWWNPLDNIGSMVDEAIRRARECDLPACDLPQS